MITCSLIAIPLICSIVTSQNPATVDILSKKYLENSCREINIQAPTNKMTYSQCTKRFDVCVDREVRRAIELYPYDSEMDMAALKMCANDFAEKVINIEM